MVICREFGQQKQIFPHGSLAGGCCGTSPWCAKGDLWHCFSLSPARWPGRAQGPRILRVFLHLNQHEKRSVFSVPKVTISAMSTISRSSPGSPTMTWKCRELWRPRFSATETEVATSSSTCTSRCPGECPLVGCRASPCIGQKTFWTEFHARMTKSKCCEFRGVEFHVTAA